MKKSHINNLVNQIRDLEDGNNWLDVNLKEKIESISEEQSFIRPVPELHSVAELVSHILVWRQSVIQKLKGIKPKLQVNDPLDWRTNNELKNIGWSGLKSELYSTTGELIELIQNKEDGFLDEKDMDNYPFRYLLEGIIQHDFYHLGQIGITLKLLKTI